MTQREIFINQITPIIQKYAPVYNIKVISPILAQAILESGSGTSDKVVSKNGIMRHNYFGLKYRAGRCPTSNGTFSAGSSEQNPDGSYRPTTDDWFSFPNMEAGVIGYFDWLFNAPNGRYSKIKNVTDPKEYLTILKNAGYSTLLKYVENNMAIINNNHLTQFDNNKIISSNSNENKSNDNSFKVRVKINDLNIRKEATASSQIVEVISPGVYTIVAEKGMWGKLKSGKGWINLYYTERI